MRRPTTWRMQSRIDNTVPPTLLVKANGPLPDTSGHPRPQHEQCSAEQPSGVGPGRGHSATRYAWSSAVLPHRLLSMAA
jgi:hypothetical protein